MLPDTSLPASTYRVFAPMGRGGPWEEEQGEWMDCSYSVLWPLVCSFPGLEEYQVCRRRGSIEKLDLTYSIWAAINKMTVGWMTSKEKFILHNFEGWKGRSASGSQTLSLYYRVTWQESQELFVTCVLRTHPTHNGLHHDLITSQRPQTTPSISGGDFSIQI